MKKFLLCLFLFVASISSFGQTCEERESKLLEGLGSFSAALLYNTYGIIGAIGDGFAANAYGKDQFDELLDGQKKLADNLVTVLEALNKNALKDAADKNYAVEAIGILKGLKRQAQLLQDYTQTKSKLKQDDYDAQRKKNWKDISKLMGIEE
jgi:hypothetical protein